MLYGAQGMIGAMIGGGAAHSFIDEPDIQDTMTGAAIGGTIAAMPKPAIAWAGLNMRNFSAGYYDQDPLYNMTKTEKLLGNKVTSIKRNYESAVRGKVQEMDPRTSNYLRGTSTKDLLKIQNRTQFEDLQIELNKLGKKNMTAVEAFKDYKNKFGGINSTPEEAIWWHKKYNARGTNMHIDGEISNIQAEMHQNDKILSEKRMSPQRHFRENSRLFQERQELKKGYERFGEVDRKWRHEIAKSESHAMWANKEWSNKRLKQAGYQWEGAYKWGDVKNYMRSVGGDQWEADINKYSNKISKRMGMTRGLMLNDTTSVNVLRNIHQQDKMIKRKPSRVFQRMGREASRMAFEMRHWKTGDVFNHLKRQIADPNNIYKFTLRDIRDYGESQGPQYKKWLDKYLNLNKYKRRYTDEGQMLWKRLTTKYGNNEALKIVKQMKAKGGFQGATRGRFQLSGIGRVTNSYLEGGINATSDFAPFVDRGRTKVAMRMVTSDLSDLPLSGHTGTQRNIPFIIEEEFRTYDMKSGKDSANLTRNNPFYGDDKRIDEFRNKRQTRGDVKRFVMGKHSVRKKARYLQRQIRKNPKEFLKYASRRLPGIALHPAVLPVGMLAWYLMGQSQGEMELDEITEM